MRRVGLGGDDQAGGVLVQAMHDPRPAHPADADQAFAAVRDQGVDQGPVRVAGRRMHDQPGRLVDHDQGFILVGDGQRDILSLRHRVDRRWHRQH